MISSPGRRFGAWLVVVVCVVPAALMVFDWRFHEFWRDEAQAFTLARDVELDQLYGQLREQGLPPLYYLLLKAGSMLLPSPLPLIVLGWLGNAAMVFGTYKLLDSISGAHTASLAVTIAFSLTYAYAYELGVIVRQYSLGLGLALMSLAYLRDALQLGTKLAVWLGTVTGGLAAVTSAHTACVSGGALLVFGVMMLFCRSGVRTGWPTLLALPCFGLTLHMAMPYAGRVAVANVDAHHGAEHLLRVWLQMLATGVMPFDWWRLDSLPVAESWSGFARYVAFLLLAGGFVLAAAIRAASNLPRRPSVEVYCPLAIAVGWIPLLEITGDHYYGYYRHHVHFALPGLVLMAGWGIDSALDGRVIVILRRVSLVAMAPWFLFGYFLAVGNLWLDWRYPFSDTKRHAQMLPFGAHVVADSDEFVALVAWRPDLLFRATVGHGRHVRYQNPDTAWQDRVPPQPLVREECEAAPDRVFTTDAAMAPPGCTSELVAPLFSPPLRPVDRESFALWRVDCSCASSR